MRARPLTAALAAMACAATVTVVVAAPAAAATASYPAAGSVVPDQDPFYAAPSDIASYADGAIVATRPVDTLLFGGPLVTRTWQIAFRTNDTHDAPELAVTTLVVPTAPWLRTGPRPVVSLQAPEDSVGTVCAPSYTLARNTDGQDSSQAQAFLGAGFAVALPDHEGPRSQFLAGPQEGHAVLDGIRAVHRFGKAGIGASNPVGLSGYSGGAHATAWAAQLQPSYAPELRLAGVAIGGTPADPAATARFLDGGATAGFEFAAAFGINDAWPESGIAGLLNDKGRAAFAFMAGKCEADLLAHFPFQRLADYTTVADPLATPSVKAVLDEDTLGAAAPTAPVYDYHAVTDEIVPVGPDDTLVHSWCGQGSVVDRVRDPAGEHVEEAVVRLPSVVAYLSARFAGIPAPSTC